MMIALVVPVGAQRLKASPAMRKRRVRHFVCLAAEAGASQIMLGTDYPYGMGDPAAVDHILRAPGLKNAERIAMLGGNSAMVGINAR